jgi:hypothetical protein
MSPTKLSLAGSVSIPSIGGSFHLGGTIYANGVIEIDGIPGGFSTFVAQEIGRLWGGIGAAPGQIAAAMKNLGHGVAETADALMKGAKLGANVTAQALRGVNESAAAVANVLKPLLGGVESHATVRAALEFAQYSAGDITNAMRNTFAEIPHNDGPQIPAVNTWCASPPIFLIVGL